MLRKLQALFVLGISTIGSPSAAQDPFDNPSAEDTSETGATSDSPEPTEPVVADEAASATVPVESEADVEVKTATPVEADIAAAGTGTAMGDADDEVKKSKIATGVAGWEVGMHGYFRAPMALGISKRPNPDDLTGAPQTQVSYGPNRTVDSNYYSFAYTRLQERDWVEMFVQAKRKHVEANIGWMGYWFAAAGFRIPDAAWVPGIAYLTLDTDFALGKLKPNVALSGGSWWPKFGRHEKYDTYTLGQYRQMGEQLKLTVPFSDAFKTTLVQGFGTGRDGSFNLGAPPPYQDIVGLNLLTYEHVQFNYKDVFEIGLHHNMQWTRDPNLNLNSTKGKTYTAAREAKLMTVGGEVKVKLPYAGKFWVSPSVVLIKNGWALGSAGVEVVHGLSPLALAVNYLGWGDSIPNSTGTGRLMNLGFDYENKLSNILGKETGGNNEVRLGLFGLLVDSQRDLPVDTKITDDHVTQFKWGAELEYNPWKWVGIMARWDSVNFDTNTSGYLFSAITGRLSFYSNYLSGERIYLQYSRYQYGDYVTLAGTYPSGLPLVDGSQLTQSGPYAGSKPDMDVIKFQADITF